MSCFSASCSCSCPAAGTRAAGELGAPAGCPRVLPACSPAVLGLCWGLGRLRAPPGTRLCIPSHHLGGESHKVGWLTQGAPRPCGERMKTAFWVHSPSPHEMCGCSSRGKGLRLGQSHGREHGGQSPRSGGAGDWLPEGAGGKLGGCSAPQDPHLGRLSGAALMGTGCAAGQRQASEGSPSWPSFAQLALLPSCTGCCLLPGQSHWSYRAWATPSPMAQLGSRGDRHSAPQKASACCWYYISFSCNSQETIQKGVKTKQKTPPSLLLSPPSCTTGAGAVSWGSPPPRTAAWPVGSLTEWTPGSKSLPVFQRHHDCLCPPGRGACPHGGTCRAQRV